MRVFAPLWFLLLASACGGSPAPAVDRTMQQVGVEDPAPEVPAAERSAP